MKIRQENRSDYEEVFKVVEAAFKDEPFSDHKEQYLVERLRNSDAFIPELSLVAELNGKIVGHILLTQIKITNGLQEFESLALAPVSVMPKYQKRGIGSELINTAHGKAKELGYKSIILLGHENYYPRFGYLQAHTYNIHLPFEVPKENCFALELIDKGLEGVNGTVEYPKEFNL